MLWSCLRGFSVVFKVLYVIFRIIRLKIVVKIDFSKEVFMLELIFEFILLVIFLVFVFREELMVFIIGLVSLFMGIVVRII